MCEKRTIVVHMLLGHIVAVSFLFLSNLGPTVYFSVKGIAPQAKFKISTWQKFVFKQNNEI